MPDIKTTLVTGSSGQLGQSLNSIAHNYPDYAFTFANRVDLGLSNEKSIAFFFKNHQFDLIINCAAHTAVDKAESEPKLADKLNHLAVKQLTELAKQQNTKPIYISTDYVFNGTQYLSYIEIDNVAPQSVTGEIKLKGKQALLATLPNNGLIIRASRVYFDYGNNFVKTMLRLGNERDVLNVIFDQVSAPTYAHDLAEAIVVIVENDSVKQSTFHSEVYHYSNEDVCSWYDLAKAIFELSKVSCEVSPVETKDYPILAARPHYSLLNKAKIKHCFNLFIAYWKGSLQHCLSKLSQQEYA